MRISVPARLSVLAAGLVAISAVVPLPVPASWVDAAVHGRSAELEFDAERQWIRWGSGRVSVEDLVLRHRGRACAEIARLEAHLDLWPWSPGFGRPRRLVVHRPRLDLDRASAEALAQLRGARARPMATLLDVRDGRATWTDDAGRRWSVGSVRALGHTAPAATRLRITARTRAPFAGSVRAALSARDGLAAWTVDARVEGKSAPVWEDLQLDDWEWQGGPFSLHLHARGSDDEMTSLRGAGEARLASWRARERDLGVRDVRAEFSGSLAGGLRADLTATLRDAPVQAGAWASRDAAGRWWMRADVDVETVRADADTVSWLRDLDEALGEALAALTPRGEAAVRAGVDWKEDADPQWAVRVLAQDAALRYRGFLLDDGERFSFPYPVTDAHGEVAAGGKVVAFVGGGRAGSGTVEAQGSVDVRGDEDSIAVDVQAQGVPLDADFGHALSGNPELATLWRRLGRPDGGTLDFDLRVRDAGDGARVVLRGRAAGARAVPSDLPVEMHVERADFTWRDGETRFSGALDALGSRIVVEGAARDEGGAQGLRLRATGEGLRCSPAERVAVESYLKLPRGISTFDPHGDLRYALEYRRPPGAERPSLWIDWESRDATLAWPGMELTWTGCRAAGGFVARGDRALLSIPRASGALGDGRVHASVTLTPGGVPARATVAGEDLAISTGLVTRLRELLGEEGWGAHLAWSGKAGLRAELDPRAPGDFRARVRFAPLLLADLDDPGDPRYTLSGAVHVEPGRFRSPRVRMRGADFDYWVTGVRGAVDGNRLVVDGTFDSVAGLRLSTQFPLLADREVVGAFERIGLDGTVVPRSVAVHAVFEEGAPPRLRGTGTLEVRDLEVDGPPSMRGGAGLLRIDALRWDGPDDFAATLRLEGGAATMAGLAVDEVRARIAVDPAEIRWEEVEAAVLGGRVRSDFTPQDGGEPVTGGFALGLSPDAPVRMEFGFSGLQLDRMRRELGLGGSLGGELDGWMDVVSPTPSPAGYRGSGYLRIERGTLGTVPVLKNMWAVAGVDPPVFDSGEAFLHANGEDRVVIRSFSLYHDLLEVTGRGFIRLDTHMRMIVTMQTFGVLGRLPLIEDVLGWVVEQDVRGPLERPVVLQRVLHKLSGREIERLPTPLWVPDPPRPDWDRSPIEPVGAGGR